MPIQQIDLNRCNGCGMCVKLCPRDVIRIEEQSKKPAIKYPEDCTDCGFCQAYCPKHAITMQQGIIKFVSWR
ncbi:MAG: 4Fe-4S binding protein [Candidatus Bathyarchaeia archaeon]